MYVYSKVDVGTQESIALVLVSLVFYRKVRENADKKWVE